MRVKIGPYVNRWISYIYEKYMNRKYDSLWPRYAEIQPEPVDEKLVEQIDDLFQWIYDHTVNLYLDKKERKVLVQIHKYDTWSMDHTLALIILPMLKQLQETKQGAPFVDDEDVPEHLRSTNAPPKENEWDLDEHHFARWEWVLEEIIWSFEQKCRDDWMEDYYEYEDDPTYKEGLGLGVKFVWDDLEGCQAHQERMSNGFRLFGKYYENLWT